MHAKAMSATMGYYEKWEAKRYFLRVKEGNRLELERILGATFG
jgi:hypothetical protein